MVRHKAPILRMDDEGSGTGTTPCWSFHDSKS